MNKIKITILLLVSVLVLLFSSCGGMTVADTDNVSIDLSSVVSKAAGGETYVKIWLFAEGTVTPYDLGDDAYQAVGTDGVVTIRNIPVGPVYKIYLSLGTKNSTTNVFTTTQTFNGKVTVTGGTSTEAPVSEVDFEKRGITPVAAYTGKSVKGAAVVDGTFYTVSAAGDKLYYGETASSKTAASGFTFNSVDEGYNNMVIISSANDAGKGFVGFDGTSLDYAYSDGLATALDGAAVNVLNADVFWESTEGVEMTVGHTEGGLILHMYIDGDPDDVDEWMPVDLGPMLDEMGIPLAGQLIKGLTVVKKYDSSTNELDALWIYMISKAGNFRIQIPLSGDGMDLEGEDAIMEMFEDFVTDNGALNDRVILNITNPAGNTLYIGTDSGLYKATATDVIKDMKPTLVAGAGSRIKLLASSLTYTACVTPLELILLRNNDNKTARIAFNEGLPVSGLLTDGVTGLDWSDDNTLYVAGNYGVSTVNAADADLVWK